MMNACRSCVGYYDQRNLTNDEEIKRRTRVARFFPNPASCLRLVLALCVETHEAWLEDHRYLNMDLLKGQKTEALRQAA